MTEKELKSLNYDALKEYALSLGLEVEEGLKKTELQNLVLNSEEFKSDIEPEPETPKDENVLKKEENAFEKELKKRTEKLNAPSAFENELNRRLGKRVRPRTFEEEVKFRENRVR